VASSGIRAAARAAAATATHFGPHPAVSSTADLGGGRTAVVGRDALTDEQGAGRSDCGAAQDVTPCPTPRTVPRRLPRLSRITPIPALHQLSKSISRLVLITEVEAVVDVGVGGAVGEARPEDAPGGRALN